VILKPFEDSCNNIIEAVNEIFIFVFLMYLFIMNNRTKWTKGAVGVFMNILTISAMVVVIILISKHSFQ